MIYSSLQSMPEKLMVRRPGEDGIPALKGRPTLMAIKDLWAKVWAFEPLLERLEKHAIIAIHERPVIIQSAGGQVSEAQSQKASDVLGQKVLVEANLQGITRVFF